MAAADFPNPIFEQFHGVTVKDVLADKKQNAIYSLKFTDSVEHAVKLFSTNKILSAPVLNDDGKFAGFIDVLDILKYITLAAPTDWSLKQDELQSLKIAGRAISLIPIKQVLNWSELDPIMAVEIHAPASNLIKIFSHGFHRAAVFDKDQIVGIVSQSDAVRYLSQHLHMGKLKDVGSKTLQQLGYGAAQLETISKTATVLEALKKMADKRVGQLAVIDEDSGRLVANFSASDLRGLYQENFPKLLDTVAAFLGKHSPDALKPICGLPSSTLIDIVNELSQSKLHHLWVVDDFKPVSIISLTDVMKISYSKH